MSVLIGYVPTPVGDAALDAAIGEAHRRETLLLVVNHTSGAGEDDPSYADNDATRRLRQKLDGADVAYTMWHSVSPQDPAEEIVTRASERSVELIVIGLRRRSPVGKLLLGSTAQQILLDATCPVLAVKP